MAVQDITAYAHLTDEDIEEIGRRLTREMDIVLTFMLRGVMDVSLYEEYSDRDEVITAISNTIRVVTDHYREQVYALRAERTRGKQP